MARAAHAQLDLDKIVWMPTGAPRYRQAPVASAEHRVAMLRLALESEREGEIDTRELAPGATGYTVDTLLELRLELGRDTTMILLLGADQYEKLGSWHRSSELFSLCRFAVFGRPSTAAPLAEKPPPGVLREIGRAHV